MEREEVVLVLSDSEVRVGGKTGTGEMGHEWYLIPYGVL